MGQQWNSLSQTGIKQWTILFAWSQLALNGGMVVYRLIHTIYTWIHLDPSPFSKDYPLGDSAYGIMAAALLLVTIVPIIGCGMAHLLKNAAKKSKKKTLITYWIYAALSLYWCITSYGQAVDAVYIASYIVGLVAIVGLLREIRTGKGTEKVITEKVTEKAGTTAGGAATKEISAGGDGTKKDD